MQDRHPKKPLRAPAALAGTLAVALALGWSGGCAFAQNADDEENVPLDTKLFRQLMRDLGLKRDGEGIEYRERAPLVVPPTRNLPPPQPEGTAAAAANPAWPKDPDVAARRKSISAAERARLKGVADAANEESRALRPDELDRGGRAAAGTHTGPSAPDADDASRPLSPAQLGHKTSLWDSMFSSFGPQKTETVPFGGEPPRSSMTAPPPGYQTPSAAQPYGLTPKDTRRASTPEERVEGTKY
jgi:hypothetical protein